MTRPMLAIAAAALLGGCAVEKRIEGQVLDLWGNPVEGATVKLEGTTERPLTDAYGRFYLPHTTGDLTIKAGKEGYIQASQEISVAEGDDPPTAVFELYPEPEEKGFYLVGFDDYVELPHEPVEAVGTEIKVMYGIKDTGIARVPSGDHRVLYHTQLKMEQVKGIIKPTLHKLEWAEEIEVVGALTTTAQVSMWTSAEEMDVEVTPLKSRDDFLISLEGLEKGRYAISTMGLMSDGQSEEDFQRIPEPLRIVFPFEIK